MPHILGSYPQKTQNQRLCKLCVTWFTWDSFRLSRKRLFTFQFQSYRFFFLWLRILLVLIVVVSWFYDTLFSFTFSPVSFQVVTWQWFSIFSLPLCTYCLSIFYRSNLRMSIGYLQPLVYLCSRTRSPMLSDVNRGNSCIWLHLLT